MKLSALIVLAGALAAGNSFAQVKQTAQEKLEQREALRRAAVAEQQKRKDDFARRCVKRGITDAELESCRAAYRRL